MIKTDYKILDLRLHRAESWLKCSEIYSNDDDVSFISQWIAFNSCYLTDTEKEERLCERESFKNFIKALIINDKQNRIENCLWDNYSDFIRTLIDNHFVYSQFWVSIRHGDSDWKDTFEKSKILALKALSERNVVLVMSIVLDRLYCLRNQLMHGGATYHSSINRQQVKDGKRMLSELMPIIVEIMKTSGKEYDWGEISYPVIK